LVIQRSFIDLNFSANDLNFVSGQTDHAFDVASIWLIGIGENHNIATFRGLFTKGGLAPGKLKAVGHAVRENKITSLESRLHRARRHFVSSHDEASYKQGQQDRDQNSNEVV